MSEEASKTDTMMCCASCGTGRGGGIELKKCNGCHLVRYCSVKCQREHRPKHKKECKKRAAELRDELLFQQPESSNRGDCPICCLPLSVEEKSALNPCCCKRICSGCLCANMKRELEGNLEPTCPFCRSGHAFKEHRRKVTKRAEANDSVALCEMGQWSVDEGDFDRALECFTKSLAFGNYAEAHYQLALMYHDGRGVEKDEKKVVYHLEEAAIGGHPDARHNLGHMEESRGRTDRAVKHLIIAANMGLNESLEALKKFYRDGLVSKNDLASTLRAHQAAVEATKSPLREEAAMFMRKMKK